MPSKQYRYNYIQQYVKIPDGVSSVVNNHWGSEDTGVKHCISIICANLLVYSKVAYSRRKEFYTKNRTQYYTYTYLLKAVEILESQNYILSNLGYRGKNFSKGFSSTLSITPSLVNRFEPLDKLQLDIAALPLFKIDDKPVYSFENPSDNKLLSTLPHPPTIYGTVLNLNRKYFNLMQIDFSNIDLHADYIETVGLTRHYKNAEVGRWFQHGGNSYQTLPKEQRQEILLNGEKVTELDYPAMHPHILCAWEKQECPNDFYEQISSFSNCPRTVVKLFLLRAINAANLADLVRSINFDIAKSAREDSEEAALVLYDELKKCRLTARELVDDITTAYPVVSKYIFSGLGNKLMLIESNIVTCVMTKLHDLNIPALPVHDSLIVPKKHARKVKTIMEQEYHLQTGYSISVH